MWAGIRADSALSNPRSRPHPNIELNPKFNPHVRIIQIAVKIQFSFQPKNIHYLIQIISRDTPPSINKKPQKDRKLPKTQQTKTSLSGIVANNTNLQAFVKHHSH